MKVFLNALNVFEHDVNSVLAKLSDEEGAIFALKETLKASITKCLKQYQSQDLNQGSDLAKGVADLQKSVQDCFMHWETQMDASRPMRALSRKYEDRIIFLVFGKVNAGKSSFCNFITDLFLQDSIRRFTFVDGEVVDLKEARFREGFTETTATIQGVEIGKRFVLLDSPGLHSVKEENGNLTRVFVDSTDAILWLTPSTSPGQVQELKDLKEEISKNKPLLPIITRSDVLDEDWDDEKGDIVQVLKNKSFENRVLQESDVFKRLQDFNSISIDLVKKPLSISIHAYKSTSESTESLKASGLMRLDEQLALLIDEAKKYKTKKAQQQLENFVNGVVISSLNKEIMPVVDKLTKDVSKTILSLESKKTSSATLILADVNSEVPSIVARHKSSRNKQGIATELNQLITQSINNVLQHELSQLVKDIQQASISLEESTFGDFKDETITFEKVKGSGWASALSSAGGVGGALGGAALGSMLLPGIGTAIGGLIGGLLGGAAGDAMHDYIIEKETVTEIVGTSSEIIINDIVALLKVEIPKQVDSAFMQVIQMLDDVKAMSSGVSAIINDFNHNVKFQLKEN